MPSTGGVNSGAIPGANSHNRVDASAGAFTLTLPTATSCAGQELTIVKTDASANTVTIAVANGSGDALNVPPGASVISTRWKAVRLRSTGSAWELAS